MNAKIEAAQRAEQRENELREAEAEARKVIAKAKGEADSVTLRAMAEAKANALVSESLTSKLLAYRLVNKWDGRLPETVATGLTGLLKQVGNSSQNH